MWHVTGCDFCELGNRKGHELNRYDVEFIHVAYYYVDFEGLNGQRMYKN